MRPARDRNGIPGSEMRGQLHLPVDNGAGNSFAAGVVRMLLLEHKRLEVIVGLADRLERARSLPIQINAAKKGGLAGENACSTSAIWSSKHE